MHPPVAVRLMLCAVLLAFARGDLSSQASSTAQAADREYILEATMLGYRGVGGEIDGVRNPTLWARPGESVRITLVNGELMVHDVVLEKLNVRTLQILEKAERASVTFKATESDIYFCSVPGHRAAGMEGRFEVSEAPPTASVGVAPSVNGREVALDFESGTLENWTPTGDAFEVVKGDVAAAGSGPRRDGYVGSYWVSSGLRGGGRKGTLTSAPFTVNHPYASFLVSGGAFASTRVELVLAGSDRGQTSPLFFRHLHDLRRRSIAAAAGGRRSPRVQRQAGLHPPG